MNELSVSWSKPCKIVLQNEMYYFQHRSEEPVLTNMDISTGHMVLVSSSYSFNFLPYLQKKDSITWIFTFNITVLYGRSLEESGPYG